MTKKIIKIAIPNDNPNYKLLTQNAENVIIDKNIELVYGNEKEVSDLFAAGKVDIALLNPYSYGLGLKKADYRIIPINALVSFGYSEIGTIYFKPKSQRIKKMAIVNKDNFLNKLALIIISENFEMEFDVTNVTEIDETWVDKFDSLIAVGKPFSQWVKMDLGDEWELLCEQPLPLAFWVCREDFKSSSLNTSVNNLLGLFAEDYKGSELNIHDEDDENIETQRTGKLATLWNQEVEEAINFTLEFLYYHQQFDEMPSVKLFEN